MTTAAILCRVALVAVFGVAAVAKLADRPATRRSVVAFGVPDGLAALAMWLLIAAELTTAALLCGGATAWFGTILALALLVVFCVAAGANLAKGRTPECNCFGQVRSEPIGPGLLVRNVAFAALALVVAAAAGASDVGPSLWAPATDLTGAGIAATVVVGVLAVAVVLLAVRLRRVGAAHADLVARVRELEEARPTVGASPAASEVPQPSAGGVEQVGGGAPAYEAGLPIGAPAAAFTLPTASGPVSLADLLVPGRPVVLLFTSPTCGTCHSVLAKVAGWTESYGDVLSFAVVASQSAEANAGVVPLLAGFEPVLFDGQEIWEDYQPRWTPAAVVVGVDRTVATDTAVGLKEIALLVLRAVATARSAAASGTPSG
ncbi:hypothetical protein KSP35_20515 [Aquihabitans sp. G128]|uniref:TlpA family protein disulfide reductase n=1 Tax=Aquihabitans sp. G128 TaxID=2849779 RepID=UPI001C23EF2D|nr:MauE/DoxX family redox-associated membrane protein [Aquihabitans sp. G128]QXC60677.1 hypothetical protein KSP35_20515 [Aquihabitans sp. G128]